MYALFFFFFSSRRRHTRCSRDWSSDVCSSDLRFNQQIVNIVNLLCQPGERDTKVPGLNPKVVEEAVRSCYQEAPVVFMSYTLYDMGAYPEPAIFPKIVAKQK